MSATVSGCFHCSRLFSTASYVTVVLLFIPSYSTPSTPSRQYSAPDVVSARNLKALIFYTINPLLYEKRPLYVFEPRFGGLGATCTVHIRLIGKPVVDFLLQIIELFLLDVMVDELRANIDWKSPLLKGVGHC